MIKNLKFRIHNSELQGGFTLIELLIVVSIIGILATLLMTNFVGVRQRARDGQRKSDLRQVQSALELYRADIGSYPDSLPACDGIFSSDGTPTGTIYMQKLPCDPSTGVTYAYTPSGTPQATYSITACLENPNDSQKDDPVVGFCTTSFTLQNP